MAQIFHPSTNPISKISIFGGVFFIAGLFGILGVVVRSPNMTNVGVPREQPVPFSHKHHVADDGIDCRYCHTAVETSAFAGIPPTQTCMNCHSQLYTDSPILEPVRASDQTGQPIEWTRVHDLPDYVYFDHSIHVNKGVGCATCHGQVDEMPLMWKENTLLMEWCIECHRNPEEYVRPREEVFNMGWQPPADQVTQGLKLVDEYHIQSKTDCSTCHR